MKYQPEYSPSTEVHITSVLVKVMPLSFQAVCDKISQIESAEIHPHSDDGKLIVCFEANSLQIITNQIDEISAFEGVVDATLIYHHCEDASAMNDMIDVDPNAPLQGPTHGKQL